MVCYSPKAYFGALWLRQFIRLRAWWVAASVPEQRHALRDVVRVRVQPVRRRGGRVFDESRVQVEPTGRWYATAADVYADAGGELELYATEAEADAAVDG